MSAFAVALAMALAAPVSRAGEAPRDPLAGIDLEKPMKREGNALHQDLDDGRRAALTLDPDLQRFADDLLARGEVQAGAVVVLSARTGRVLVLSQRRARPAPPDAPCVALDPSPPAASLFKIVTAAALMEKARVGLDHRICYHGGSQRLFAENLADDPVRDTACASVAAALGHSINAVFAKLSDRHLDRGAIEAMARAFGFDRDLPFDLPVPPSRVEIPEDRLERARAAAGFWHTHVSPLHAAMIAQAVANRGIMLRPFVVERVEDASGATLHAGGTRRLGRAVREETARALLEAMRETVERGTARKAFHDARGRPLLPGVTVSGKTGTLNGSDPFRAYSWFAGAAPAENPEVALAVLVVNDPAWRIKAASASAEILGRYFGRRRRG